MKKVPATLVCLIVLLSFLAVPAWAEDEKVHTIHSAHFDVILNEDGSADITEIWEVTFVSGEFVRFRKEIYTAVTGEEKFTDVTNISVMIDGEPCSPSEIDGYSVVTTNDSVILRANRKSENVSRTYTFSYTLTDVVKKLDDQTSLFTYRFVGKNHPVIIKLLTVNVTAPHQGSFKTVYKSLGSVTTDSTTARFSARNSKGLYKLSLEFTSNNAFGVPFSQGQSSDSGNDPFAGLAAFLVLLLNPITWLIVFWIWKDRKQQEAAKALRARQEALRQYANDHPEEMPPLIRQLDEEFAPSQIASLVLSGGGPIKMITVIIAELILSGHITLTHDKKGMLLNSHLPAPELPHHAACLHLVEMAHEDLKQSDFFTRTNYLSFNHFTNYITSHAETLRPNFEDIRAHLGINALLRNHPRETELRAVVTELLPHLQIRAGQPLSFSRMLDSAKDGRMDTLAVILYMGCAFSANESEPIDLQLSPLGTVINPWYGIAPRGADSGNGCSGCSSCGGCGGCSGCGGCGGE